MNYELADALVDSNRLVAVRFVELLERGALAVMSYCDELALSALQGLVRHPTGPVVVGFQNDKVKVTVLLAGDRLDESLMVAATLVKARACSGLVYVSHVLADDLSMPRQVLAHAFALGEHCSWMMAYSILDDGTARLVQPFRLSVVAPAVEILEVGLRGEVNGSHLLTARTWLENQGHAVLLA